MKFFQRQVFKQHWTLALNRPGYCGFMPLIYKFVCQLCCWLSQKKPDRARLSLPVLSFPYITKWVDAHTNLPTRARWIAKADVALY